ncbi:hypothetical protein FQN50_003364 [Emmonsiellopsis sp. PD_5]|nr:hypothetical protein FQN50_003364 [Emmonsiellopsis sp. PD_5]
MDDFACAELLDSMQAFYKAVMKTFINNVAIQVIKHKLICEIWTIFTPSDVATMPPDLISQIAGETEESQVQQQQLEWKLKTLQEGETEHEKFLILLAPCLGSGTETLNIENILPASSDDGPRKSVKMNMAAAIYPLIYKFKWGLAYRNILPQTSHPNIYSDAAFWSIDVDSSYHPEAEFAKCWIVHQ